METSASGGPTGNGHIFYKLKESRTHFTKTKGEDGRAVGRGQFLLKLDVIALQGEVYIPMSIASGKKPTGLIYQIEGTAQGDIATANVECKGEGVTQITLGTLVYAKIPQGRTASFKIVVDMKGSVNKAYRIVINRINYKLDPSDARYKRFDVDIDTGLLKFK